MFIKKFRRITCLLLVLVMSLSLSVNSFAAFGGLEADPYIPGDDETQSIVDTLSESQMQAYGDILELQSNSGLIGFEGEYELTGGDEMVSVIVLFEHQPAATVHVQAAMERNSYISMDKATMLAESDHISFQNELDELFGSYGSSNTTEGISAARIRLDYDITSVYKDAVNGVAIKVPSFMVAEMANFDSVRAIYPNEIITLDTGKISDIAEPYGDNSGNAKGRAQMNANMLHDEGFTGQGVYVCVIDTGVDYTHPDLINAFDEGPANVTVEDRIDGIFYGRNFIDDSDQNTFPGSGYPKREDRNPMEVTYEEWLKSGQAEYSGNNSFYTYHGTHVTGTVVATGDRDAEDGVSALGVAPGAKLFVYRVFGAYSRSTVESVLNAINYVPIDKPDIVNMSLGVSSPSATQIYSLAVNNIMLANDILFVIAAGNAGSNYFTVGSPGTSSTAITVGAAETSNRSIALTAENGGGTSADLSLMYLNGGFTKNDSSGKWISTYSNLKADANSQYEIILMPRLGDDSSDGWTSEDTSGSFDIGTGTEEEFVKLNEEIDIEGKIVVVARGSVFTETMALAKQYGAGGVLLLNSSTGNLVDANGNNVFGYIRDEGDYCIPFFVLENYYDNNNEGDALEAVNWLKDVVTNGYKISFTAYRPSEIPASLASFSSRGPVAVTHDIKPDVVAHGVAVYSTWPIGIKGYSTPYAAINGTSMASPAVAGAAALLKSYNQDWTSSEIKTRLMNTAKPVQGGVYEVGAGFVDVHAAAHADTVVEVDFGRVYTSSDDSSGQTVTGSFSFGTVLIGDEASGMAEVSLSATIYNESRTDKTYTVGHFFNNPSVGQKIKDAGTAGVTLSISNMTVPVSAGQSSSFEVTIKVPKDLDPEVYSGSYEGYVTVSDGYSGYSLPFAIYVKAMEPVFQEGNYFLNRPVISTGANRQTELSASSDFYYSMSVPAYLGFFLLDMDKLGDNYDLSDYDSFKQAIMGYIGEINRRDYNTGVLYYENDLIKENYVELIYNETSGSFYYGSSKKYESGQYKILIQAMTNDFDYYYYLMDLYVDNVAPEVTITNNNYTSSSSGYNSLILDSGVTEAVISGNVYDSGLEYMREHEILFSIWEEDDLLPRLPDQSYNKVVASVGGEYYLADVQSNGDFIITIENINVDEPVPVTLYAVDGFSIMQIGTSRGMQHDISNGFDINNPSLKFSVAGHTYAYVGSNYSSMLFYIEDDRPRVTLSYSDVRMRVNDTYTVTAMLNSKAVEAGDSIASFTSSNPDVVSVTKYGSNAVLTAYAPGEATMTVTTTNGLTKTIRVTVTVLFGEGIDMNTGDYIYYGATKHVTAATTGVRLNIDVNGNVTDDNPITRETEESPILWEVMPEEIVNNSGDGLLTLFSKYVLDVTNYSNHATALSYYKLVPEIQSIPLTIKHYLNGGRWLRGISDWGENATNEEKFLDSKFIKNFNGAEGSVIPTVRNEIAAYNLDGTLSVSSSYYVDDGYERFFLPWIFSKDSNSITFDAYWSAGKDLNASNQLREDNIKATLKNGAPISYWLGMDGARYVNNEGKIPSFAMPYFGQGVRPGMKLNPESVIFAYEITADGGEGKIAADGINYHIDNNTFSRFFKLSVQGSDGGTSIGRLTGEVAETSILTTSSVENLLISGGVSNGHTADIVAYKIVDDAGSLVKYGELVTNPESGEFEFDTAGLDAGVYRIYVWPQKNNEKNSHEAGVVNCITVYMTDDEIDSLEITQGDITLITDEIWQLFVMIDPISAIKNGVRWSSSDTAVVDVDRNGVLTAKGPGSATITAASAANSDIKDTINVTVVRLVESVVLSETVLRPEVGSDKSANMLTAAVSPDNASDGTVLWSSTNNSITVDEYGSINPLADGVAIITATAQDGSNIFGACVVYAGNGKISNYVDSVVISSEVGGSKLAEIVNLSIGTESGEGTSDTIQLYSAINPGNADFIDVVWSSSNPYVAYVDQSGQVTALRAGSAVITVTTLEGVRTDMVIVNVADENVVPVEGVTLNRTSLSMSTGGAASTFALAYTVVPGNAKVTDVVWISDNEAVATVDNGVVTAIGEGTAEITVNINDEFTASCRVTVSNTTKVVTIHDEDDSGITGKTISMTNASSGRKELRLTAKRDNVTADSNTVTWVSSNPSVATVDMNGHVLAVGKGTTTITAMAKDNGVSASITVNVSMLVESIQLRNYNTKSTIYSGNVVGYTWSPFGETVYFIVEAVIDPTNVDNSNLKWSSSDPSVVNIMDYNNTIKYFLYYGVGTAVITIESADGNAKEEIIFEVKRGPASGEMTITPGDQTLALGTEGQITVTMADVIDISARTVGWRSNAATVATVDGNGCVTALGVGIASITAASTINSGASKTAVIRVSADVIYHSNDGTNQTDIDTVVPTGSNNTNAVANHKVWADDTFDAPEGMRFKEWNTRPDGSGEKFAPEATINMKGKTANVDLYAIWETDDVSNTEGWYTFEFHGLQSVTIQYCIDGVWYDYEGTFDDTATVYIPDAKGVRLVFNGMTYEIDLDDVAEPGEIVIPMSSVTITSLTSECWISISQDNWVYTFEAVVGEINEIVVFDSVKPFQLWISKVGYEDIRYSDVWAGDTVELDIFFNIPIPAEMTDIRVLNTDWVDTTLRYDEDTMNYIITLMKNNSVAVLYYIYEDVEYSVEFTLDGTNPIEWLYMEVEPTCHDEGYTINWHTPTGDKFYTNYVTALGHDFSDPVWDGIGWYIKCSRCGYGEYKGYDYEDGLSDAEFLANKADEILQKGLNSANLVLEGSTLRLVFGKRVIVLSYSANNKNQSGRIELEGGGTLIFDIKGNGSNVKEFRIVF